MVEVIIRSDKFDWDDIDYSLIVFDSCMVPTIGSTFIHKFKSGILEEHFKFKVIDIEYMSGADYFNEYCRPENKYYLAKVYVEPVSENATYARIAKLFGRDF